MVLVCLVCFFLLTIYFFFCLGVFVASVYIHVGPVFSDFAEVFYGSLSFRVELYYKE